MGVLTLNDPRGYTGCQNSAGLAEGTNNHTIKTVAANGTAFTDYAIAGIGYALADADNIAVTACAQQADLTTCLYLVSVNASGTVTTTKGEEVLSADLAAGNAALFWPECPAANCPIGGFKIATSGATFTAGTTDHGDGTVTDTYYNFVGGMPATPITS